MIGESVTPIGSQKTHQFLAFTLREASAHADVLQRARSIKQAKQKRADCRSVASFVPSKPGHDAIAIALMLDLEHHALVRLIGAGNRLGPKPVEARALGPAGPIQPAGSVT